MPSESSCTLAPMATRAVGQGDVCPGRTMSREEAEAMSCLSHLLLSGVEAEAFQASPP